MNAQPIKVLLVDDTEENLVALEALLRRDGRELLKASSGAEALELLLAHEVALALLDVQMPGMDGFELAELMRGSERTKHVPIIFVTAGTRDPQRVFKGYESGAVDFLFKPIEPHVLNSKVDVFLELYRKRHELAEVLRLNELFIGILGHDLRNPLGTLVTGAQLLEMRATDADLGVLQRMIRAGGRMTRMIDQMLDLTRARFADGLGFVCAREPLDVASLAQRTIDELRLAHAERPISLEVHGDCTANGDADRLLQLFSNLIANALQHGTAGAPVSVSVAGGEREVSVSVHNHGLIPPALLPTIFDPFRGQSSASTPNAARLGIGLGLGLFISKQIALAHGGKLEAMSNASRAETVFTMHIPRAK